MKQHFVERIYNLTKIVEEDPRKIVLDTLILNVRIFRYLYPNSDVPQPVLTLIAEKTKVR